MQVNSKISGINSSLSVGLLTGLLRSLSEDHPWTFFVSTHPLSSSPTPSREYLYKQCVRWLLFSLGAYFCLLVEAPITQQQTCLPLPVYNTCYLVDSECCSTLLGFNENTVVCSPLFFLRWAFCCCIEGSELQEVREQKSLDITHPKNWKHPSESQNLCLLWRCCLDRVSSLLWALLGCPRWGWPRMFCVRSSAEVGQCSLGTAVYFCIPCAPCRHKLCLPAFCCRSMRIRQCSAL